MIAADEDARRRIRQDLGTTFVVEAAAGTGKTTELVARMVAVVRAGAATLARIVAVTFTDKAAGEMKLRLRAELERARGSAAADERRRLDEALAELEVARVGTIHAFCADLLRERPLEARVDPLFELAGDLGEGGLLGEAFEGWFQDALAHPGEGVRRVLRRREPRALLRRAAESLAEHRDFGGAWRRDPFDREAAIDAVVARLGELASLAARAERADTSLAGALAELERFIEELGRREAVRGRDYDGLEAELRVLVRPRSMWRRRGGPDFFGGGLTRAEVLARRDAAKVELDAFLARADADLAACLREELRPAVAAYERLKARAGRLDFLDLLIRARDLLRDDAAVRAEMQERYRYLFVDEAQDIDPLQAEILELLAGGAPGKLFLVGDPKQSIYRFRRADVLLYEDLKARLRAGGAEVLHLSTSFRAVPSIQAAVNAAFAPRMQGGGQAEYVPLRPFRNEVNQPSVIALPIPRPYGEHGISNQQIEASYPDAVAAFVEFLVRESGWTVTERDHPDRRVPIAPRHVGLLFRRFQGFGADLTRPTVRALEARRIPHVLVGGRAFHERDEVAGLRNALLAIERPSDELSVFATLRGPFFALGDDALLAFRHTHGTLHPVRWLRRHGELSELTAPVADALAILGRLHLQRNRRPIADTIGRLLAETRAQAGVAIWPAGEQALANLLRVLDVARRFEAGGATSFRAFCDKLDEDAERGDAGEAPFVEEGSEGVRLMTVHRAKGLELPVVILCDPTAPLAQSTPSRHVLPDRRAWLEPLAGCAPVELVENAAEALRRDREEGDRLAYVAATRARDLLVVPVVGDEERPGWLEALLPAVFPEPRRRRQPEVAPGCPPFGDDSVLERPLMFDAVAAVAPGAHVARAGGHPVVWWDPAALGLDRARTPGLRQQKMLEADDGGSADAGARAHEEWLADRRRTLERGAAPSRVVRTATEAPSGPGVAAVTVTTTAAARLGRPHGRRFGALVHAVLERVALDADAEGVRAVAGAQARLVGAPDDEIDAAVAAVTAALAHPLLRRAAAAVEVRRETPVFLAEPDGTLVEGVIDLAFREVTGWTVVEFKTDVEAGEAVARHAAQVAVYVRAIAAATGLPVEGGLLLV